MKSQEERGVNPLSVHPKSMESKDKSPNRFIPLLLEKDPSLKVLFKRELNFNKIFKPPYVSLVGAIIGQLIKFEKAVSIRKALYTKLGYSFTLEDVDKLEDR